MRPQQIASLFQERDETRSSELRERLAREARRWATAESIQPGEIDDVDEILQHAGIKRSAFVDLVATAANIRVLREQVAADEADNPTGRRIALEIERDRLEREMSAAQLANIPPIKARFAEVLHEIAGCAETERALQARKIALAELEQKHPQLT